MNLGGPRAGQNHDVSTVHTKGHVTAEYYFQTSFTHALCAQPNTAEKAKDKIETFHLVVILSVASL